MDFLNRLLSWAGFVCIVIVLVLSPWLFGAWEMWWFWPFALLIFLAAGLFGLRLTLYGVPKLCARQGIKEREWGQYLVMVFLPFLVYAAIRMFQADVFMDAERSLLLFLTPYLLGVQIVFGFDRRQLALLYKVLFINILLLGLYGIVNHAITKSHFVLWVPGYPQYYLENRASGSYFCPDHYAGVLELGLCLCLGLFLDRQVRRAPKLFAAVLSIVCLAGVVFSRSRGAGLTVIVVGFAALLWGFYQWAPRRRWIWRGTALGSALVGLLLFCVLASGYMGRFTAYFRVDNTGGQSRAEIQSLVLTKLSDSVRGRMYQAALRAWRSAPVYGIGPGMHQNLWPHFAPSPDSNLELGIWPSQPNNHYHSFEVHSDWLQLLQEYGLVGVLLLLLPGLLVFWILYHALISEESEWRADLWHAPPPQPFRYHVILAGLLSLACMGFHSLGDFNLQMPATVWMLAAILSLSLAAGLRSTHSASE